MLSGRGGSGQENVAWQGEKGVAETEAGGEGGSGGGGGKQCNK